MLFPCTTHLLSADHRFPRSVAAILPAATQCRLSASVRLVATWNILRHASGNNASSLTAFRPFGSNQRVDSVEKRADRSSNLSSGAKARALIVAADRVATRSSGASALSTCAKPDRTSVASGKRVSVRVDLGGRLFYKKKINNNSTPHASAHNH